MHADDEQTVPELALTSWIVSSLSAARVLRVTPAGVNELIVPSRVTQVPSSAPMLVPPLS